MSAAGWSPTNGVLVVLIIFFINRIDKEIDTLLPVGRRPDGGLLNSLVFFIIEGEIPTTAKELAATRLETLLLYIMHIF